MDFPAIWKIVDANSDRQFDLIKIVLDKGALALLIVLAGLMTTLLIERYKALLNRQNDLIKIFIPQIVDLLTHSERLYDEGVSVLLELAKKFHTYEEWLKKLLDAEVDSVTMPLPTGPDCRDALLKRKDGSSITFGQLLVDLAPDESIRAIVNEDRFWIRKSL